MRKIMAIALILTFASCDEEDVINPEDIIITFEPDKQSILADGSSTVAIRAILDPKGDKTLRTIYFETDRGIFSESEKNSIVKKAEVNLDDEVEAKVVLIAPTTPGDLEIRAQVELEDQTDRYISRIILDVDSSLSASIELTADAFSVENNFASEITLTGVLKNIDGNKVSEGVSVVFTDRDANDAPIGGRFRSENLTTGSDSKISAIYSPGNIGSGQFITLEVTILDINGNPSGMSDALSIYVRPN